MDRGINTFLEGLNASNFISVFKENRIGLSTLPLLTDSDLVALGIEEKKLRENILKHGQSKSRKLCKSQYIPFEDSYINNILSDINGHMLKIESNILTSYIRLVRFPGQPLDPMISQDLHSSEAALKSMKIIDKNLLIMENEFKKLEINLKKCE